MKKIIRRIKEPSTWAGIGVLAALFGVPVEQYTAVAQAIAAVAGAAAVLMPEKAGDA